MINYQNLPMVNFSFYGGVLADNVGLGKTFSVILLIGLKYKSANNPSLIICPKRICDQ